MRIAARTISFACLAALAGLLATATTAPAYPAEPACSGTPYNNDYAIRDFAVTTATRGVGDVSAMTLQTIACGTELGVEGQGATFIEHADISLPPGVAVNDNPPFGTYVGQATMNILYSGAPDEPTRLFRDVPFAIMGWFVDDCQNDAGYLTGGNVPGTIVACYAAIAQPVSGRPFWGLDTWVTRSPAGDRYTLTIGSVSLGSGFTRVQNMTFCGYAGDYQARACGSASQPDNWLIKNGTASAPDCAGGAGPNGIYSMTVMNKGGVRSAAARSCVIWNYIRQPVGPGKLQRIPPLGNCGLLSNVCSRG